MHVQLPATSDIITFFSLLTALVVFINNVTMRKTSTDVRRDLQIHDQRVDRKVEQVRLMIEKRVEASLDHVTALEATLHEIKDMRLFLTSIPGETGSEMAANAATVASLEHDLRTTSAQVSDLQEEIRLLRAERLIKVSEVLAKITEPPSAPVRSP